MRLLQLSSLWISIPSAVSYFLGSPIDAFVIGLQCVTSVVHHTYYTKATLIVDRAVTAGVAARTLYKAYDSPVALSVFAVSYGYISVIYVFGKLYSCFASDPDADRRCRYHASMHFLCGGAFMLYVYLIA